MRAQYTTGTARGQPVRSYRDEPNVDPGSKTETHVALRCWSIIGAGPACRLILRSGKAMTRRDTEIALQFRQAPLTFFRGTAEEACIPNWLVLQIQPDEGILLQFGAKVAQLGGAARRGHT